MKQSQHQYVQGCSGIANEKALPGHQYSQAVILWLTGDDTAQITFVVCITWIKQFSYFPFDKHSDFLD